MKEQYEIVLKQFDTDFTYELNLRWVLRFYYLRNVQGFMLDIVYVLCFMLTFTQILNITVKIQYMLVYTVSLLKAEVNFR